MPQWYNDDTSPVVSKFMRAFLDPVLVEEDVTLPSKKLIPAGTDMGSLDPEELDALELYYWSHDPETNCDLGD